ncbi:MAG: hypothetical protein EYC67_09385 [Betaproteobacteria bacterium]|nr:MAG: hypothetical protein EYC67_09385 [Betaproteobacteria bacterium]
MMEQTFRSVKKREIKIQVASSKRGSGIVDLARKHADKSAWISAERRKFSKPTLDRTEVVKERYKMFAFDL